MVFTKLFFLAASFGSVHGFAPTQLSTSSATKRPSLLVRQMDAAAVTEIETARVAFVLCFAGALGSAAIGREAIPVTYREWKKMNDLKGQGTSLGGDEIDLFGYPEPIYTNDVMAVLNNDMSVDEIMEAYPVENALAGYLRYESLAQANADKNPLAVRAVFDSLAMGINKNTVAPQKAVAQMNIYKQDLSVMRQNVQMTKTVGVTALVLLLTTLGAADFFMVYHAWHGWFPEWQGFSSMPFSLFDERGIGNLAACFVNDVPKPDVVSDAFPL